MNRFPVQFKLSWRVNFVIIWLIINSLKAVTAPAKKPFANHGTASASNHLKVLCFRTAAKIRIKRIATI